MRRSLSMPVMEQLTDDAAWPTGKRRLPDGEARG
jgi:hypothetical protein